ncbi:putative membrane protein [Babesia divergens]|uniref:Membrane protein n=1 Tax=Babesia divergens TaxID=32595 RepID=A0AAD9LGX7_BABDI|nr:putative membrane protein [Babesia divergens]
MLRYILLLICFTTFIVLGVNDIHRIAPGKFRFDDDIAYLKDDQTINYLTPDVNTGKTEQKIKPTSEQIQQSTHANREERQNASGHHDGSFIRLSSSDSPQRTQSIGYTYVTYYIGIYCTCSGTHSMLCDPDGILNETQQIELNNLLLEGTGYRVG